MLLLHSKLQRLKEQKHRKLYNKMHLKFNKLKEFMLLKRKNIKRLRRHLHLPLKFMFKLTKKKKQLKKN